jgi:hypothetical protein
MHDAHEAYIGDLSSPVKGLCPDYQEIELRMWRAVAQRFCLPRTIPVIVRMADARMLVTEAAQLFLHGRLGEGWPPSPPYPIPITCWSADRAEHEFLAEADRCQIS